MLLRKHKKNVNKLKVSRMLFLKHVFGMLTLQTGTIVLSTLYVVRNYPTIKYYY